MAIEIVSFPIKNGGSFHSYVKLPEGIMCFITLGFSIGFMVIEPQEVWDFFKTHRHDRGYVEKREKMGPWDLIMGISPQYIYIYIYVYMY